MENGGPQLLKFDLSRLPFARWLVAARLLLLNRWAGNRPVGTEHAAISGLRTQQRTAAAALIKELAGVRWHDLGLCRAAVRTGDRRFENHQRHSHEHETENGQNHAEGKDTGRETGNNRASAGDTRRARGDAATTPKQHSAAASEANNGNG